MTLDDKKILALAKKNAAKAAKAPKPRARYDDTLPPQPPVEDAEELSKFFSEMKKREF